MFPSSNRINKIIYYFFIILVLISVILIWGFSLPNIINADNDGKNKGDDGKDKGDSGKDKGDNGKDKGDEKVKDEKDKSLKTFHITANCDNGGSISPKGSQDVTEGESITFTCAADEGYNLIWLRVDNEKIEGTNSYTFTNVDSNHTIHAQFKKIDSSDDGQADEDFDNNNNGDTSSDDNNDNSDSNNESVIEVLSYYNYDESSTFYNNNLSEHDEIKSQASSFQNRIENTKNNSNYEKGNSAEKIDDAKDLFSIIEINDTNQFLDMNAVIKENEIIEILDVEDLINEGNFIKLGIEQLDLSNYNNPFAHTLAYIWDKIKDFSYHYNS
jgi:hypothetical protein